MKMNRCQVEISTRVFHESMYCEVLLNHEEAQPAYAGQYPISYEDCEEAHVTGILDINLGDTIIHAVDLNNPGKTRITKYLTAANIQGHMCFDDDNAQGTGKILPMVLGEFKIHLDTETSFVDYQTNTISLPRLGLQANFDKTQTFYTHYSVAF